MLGEVVPHEDVEEFGVATQMRVGERDQLPVPGRGGVPGRADQELAIRGDERSGHEQRRRARGGGAGHHLGRSGGAATDQAAKEGSGVFVGHRSTVTRTADDALTTTDVADPRQ